MTFINTILVIFLCSLSDYAFSCDCKVLQSLEKVRQISINESDIIFLGELIDFDTVDCSYSFSIIEKFKGAHKDSIIKGKVFSSCSLFPVDKSKWIVYAKLKGNIIDMSECLASRSEENPICLNCYKMPAPIKRFSKRKLKEFEKEKDVLKNKARVDWNNEIEILRKEKQ